MKHLAFCVALIAAPAAAAAQPYSDSMADCAGIMRASADLISREDGIALAEMIAARFESAAYVQAQREGHDAPQSVIANRVAATRNEWKAKGPGMVLTTEFGDWIDYCKSFAAHTGIDLRP